MQRIKIGHIGTKHDHSRAKLETVERCPDLFEVVGIVPESREIAERIQKDSVYAGVPVMTEEELFAVPGLKAVLVESFELDSVAAAQRCVDHGFSVHLDKPGGEDIGAYEKLLRSAKEKGLTVQLGYMYRDNLAVRRAHELQDAGKIGEITAIDTAMSTQHGAEKVRWLSCFKGGVMFWLGCHMIDLIFRFAGVPQEIIPYLNRSTFSCEETRDNTFALMVYPKFVATVRINSTEVNGYGRRQFVLCGREGSVEIKPMEGPTKMTFSHTSMVADRIYTDIKEEIPEKELQAGRYDLMMRNFYEYVTGRKQNPYSYEYELQLQKMVLAACGFAVDFREKTVL